MPSPHIRTPKEFEKHFAALREELHVPPSFPVEVLQEADAAQDRYSDDRYDATALPFIAIDPPGAIDLDQAYYASKTPQGFRLHYAIADVAAFVEPGSLLDAEARLRGVTLYSPDLRTPLHPPSISEDKASLLAGTTKPALLWTIDLDAEGLPVSSQFKRATVRVSEAISYAQAQQRIEANSENDSSLRLLKTIGELRQKQEQIRGGVSLNLPSQEVTASADGYVLRYEHSVPVENWNAQISLLTGMVAGRTMQQSGIGIVRTLPPADVRDQDELRRQARALGVDYPHDVSYPDFIRSLQPDRASHNALMHQATKIFRGAGYYAITPEAEPQENLEHAAIASIYGHVTAPLRRLVDRFANEILLAIHADETPPQWAVDALAELPGLMGKAKQASSALERATVDLVEALVLENRVGEVFEAHVVNKRKSRSGKERGVASHAVLQIKEPAVVVSVKDNDFELAQKIEAKLQSVSVKERELTFEASA